VIDKKIIRLHRTNLIFRTTINVHWKTIDYNQTFTYILELSYSELCPLRFSLCVKFNVLNIICIGGEGRSLNAYENSPLLPLWVRTCGIIFPLAAVYLYGTATKGKTVGFSFSQYIN